ncbi:galactose-specific lectin nattectin-like [Poecilia formosa]|uniref:galactose-specific lectin nattectin-like n=1 Tax=Poecilia formosa TaxID=48698 RepID=UPI0007B8D470|nr:PREDICTED: galactose-specific lectin nattectin-like [Poecilia formosa]
MAAGLVFTLLLGLSFGLWDGADACQLTVANCDKCTPGWTWYDGQCFLFMKVKKSWSEAEKFCLSLDGHLASIRSTNEYNFIRQLVYEATGKHTQTWVGGHDSPEEGFWLWSDGSKFLFHHWGPGEPNNGRGNEDCMDINFEGQDNVNDDDCAKKLPFICVIPV